ncbi:VCBS repeat-containing protein [Euzebyella saccharophila]|uniref:VCBS repeat-containing protein n=1 Tax=Euzebyella saccharophila TaxID=679664 RepID=A0ABV8JMK9_9FLAO|nr:VCBS repeat-containing protein [Euzebyella saccharophila]
MKQLAIIIGLLLSLLFGCKSDEELDKGKSKKIFSTLRAEDSGIDFKNLLTENDSLNYFTYSYLYMGGGIATGDINGDGLLDIYFTGNQVSNKLYLNKGNLQFEDVTEKAGVSGDNRWYTGVTMGDVNGDGLLDIYCSVGGKFGPKDNQLFINNGDGTFSEKASEYGLNDIGNSVQSTFFDYDKDGDLDLYVANYPPTKFDSPTFVYTYKMQNTKEVESNHLFRNDGGVFTDVTKEAGLFAFGLSLSATVGDLNNDSWPDVYVSSDFNSPDLLYLNNQDGTFKEVVKQATSHTAFYGMGADISDFNNDGFLDIFQVDMDAKTNRRKKANMASMNPQLFWDVVNAGFHYQYMHNCMQLNSGIFNEDGIPHFSNVSRITGTSSTDWSWGPLFADFDNDGHKDLFVSNGTRREINNNDYFNRLKKVELEPDTLLQLSMQIPSEKIDNFMFKNQGNLQFTRTNQEWGIEFEGFSNGVVYADLDNDGDLEVITNNIDDKASIFENHSADQNNYLKVAFKGPEGNQFGIGSRVYASTKESTQLQELTLTRGFQSSVAPELHFGFGKLKSIDTLRIVWPNNKVEIRTNVSVNQKITFNHLEAGNIEPIESNTTQLFTSTNLDNFPKYKHEENNFDDFKKQVLLPHKMSSFGPAIAVADINNDGLDDYYIGASSGKMGKLYTQREKGFIEVDNSFLLSDVKKEDVGALFVDIDQDGDKDLYVVSGGYEFTHDSPHLQDRIYINDGEGNFEKSPNALPAMQVSGSKVYQLDYDKDGDEDLLVLGRQVPGKYPSPAKSYLLKNISEGEEIKYIVDSVWQPKEFDNLGMATAAVVTDFNGDKQTDLLIVGEWMPIRAFKNTGTTFEEVSAEMGLDENLTGWWWSIAQGDFDKDGDIDYVVGNNGLNYKYKASENETFDIYVNDFDKNNKQDIVLSYYNEGKQYPLRGRECSSQQIPGIKQKFENYASFAQATLEDVYTEESLSSSLHYQVKSFSSIYLENENGKLAAKKLPIETQLSSINQFLVNDYDKDGNLDLLIAGNLFASEIETPRNDAGHGYFLKGDGLGNFKAQPASKSGFFVPGDVKDLQPITYKEQDFILAVKNNDYLQPIKVH